MRNHRYHFTEFIGKSGNVADPTRRADLKMLVHGGAGSTRRLPNGAFNHSGHGATRSRRSAAFDVLLPKPGTPCRTACFDLDLAWSRASMESCVRQRVISLLGGARWRGRSLWREAPKSYL